MAHCFTLHLPLVFRDYLRLLTFIFMSEILMFTFSSVIFSRPSSCFHIEDCLIIIGILDAQISESCFRKVQLNQPVQSYLLTSGRARTSLNIVLLKRSSIIDTAQEDRTLWYLCALLCGAKMSISISEREKEKAVSYKLL